MKGDEDRDEKRFKRVIGERYQKRRGETARDEKKRRKVLRHKERNDRREMNRDWSQEDTRV
ncbi:hypothetical protein OCU04_005565 [Sclerotinia nivalis]|uniref:Uncharacterized protein n=1 Tax=Sclerotinia nivalis TaxID=352851 RepID=A0A9X0APE3_9HELO|nr:hypothetical protein OCU04_005565 [Sclerotinia nivalis]